MDWAYSGLVQGFFVTILPLRAELVLLHIIRTGLGIFTRMVEEELL